MAATFNNFNFLPPELRAHFTVLEDFVGDLDGKDLCSPTAGNAVIDEGTIFADEVVVAINAIAEAFRQRT